MFEPKATASHLDSTRNALQSSRKQHGGLPNGVGVLVVQHCAEIAHVKPAFRRGVTKHYVVNACSPHTSFAAEGSYEAVGYLPRKC
jgi:hypothetical protein